MVKTLTVKAVHLERVNDTCRVSVVLADGRELLAIMDSGDLIAHTAFARSSATWPEIPPTNQRCAMCDIRELSHAGLGHPFIAPKSITTTK
jgi:hypothetical protein